jgi:hypothetical protein
MLKSLLLPFTRSPRNRAIRRADEARDQKNPALAARSACGAPLPWRRLTLGFGSEVSQSVRPSRPVDRPAWRRSQRCAPIAGGNAECGGAAPAVRRSRDRPAVGSGCRLGPRRLQGRFGHDREDHRPEIAVVDGAVEHQGASLAQGERRGVKIALATQPRFSTFADRVNKHGVAARFVQNRTLILLSHKIRHRVFV